MYCNEFWFLFVQCLYFDHNKQIKVSKIKYLSAYFNYDDVTINLIVENARFLVSDTGRVMFCGLFSGGK